MFFKRHPTLIVTTKVLWVFIALLCARPLLATSLVVIFTPKDHKVYIAADSLVIHDKDRHFACKIKTFPSHNCSFALAGWSDFALGDAPRISFNDSAAIACQGSGTLREKADTFLEKMQPTVISLVSYAQHFDPSKFAALANGGDILDVAFVGTEGGQVVIFVRGFHVNISGQAFSVVDQAVDNGKSMYVSIFPLGVNNAIKAYAKTHRAWATGDIATAARKFVKLEEAARPDIVGGDISLLSVDWLGNTNWIEPGLCSAEGEPQKQAKPRNKQASPSH